MTSWMWGVFAILVVVMLALDLGFHREASPARMRADVLWSVAWVAVAVAFGGVLALVLDEGGKRSAEYFACYVTEKTLSVDNLFVFVVIFRYFGIPTASQHRVLVWGILGALVLRGLFIWLGLELIERFTWTSYVLGGFLIFTAIRIAREGGQEVHPEGNPFLRMCRRFLPIELGLHGTKFAIRKDGKLYFTPLFLALIVVETTDVVFAVDSVPAALALSSDPLVLYTSNVMAVLGLRALYFVVAGMIDLFHHLRYGLAGVLALTAIKMILKEHVEIPIGYALGAVVLVLAASIVSSLVFHDPRKKTDGE